MAFKASIPKFEGPLDLMWHLIRKEQLDIFDLDMNVLCSQYLAYLSAMQEMHLEIESEYLWELAALLEYKSKKLLPLEESKIEEEYAEDPRTALVKRLLEYERYKEAAATLSLNYKQRQSQLAKPLSDALNFGITAESELYNGQPAELLKAMDKILRRLALSKPVRLKLAEREMSIDEKILEIKAQLKDLAAVFNFKELVKNCHDLGEFILTFLALLDLIKDRYLYFSVDDASEIWLKRGEIND